MKKVLPLTLVLFGLAHLAFSQKTNEIEQQPPAAKLEPSSIDFGDQVVKKPSKSQRMTVTNTGAKKLYINSVVINGDERQDFALIQDTCTGRLSILGRAVLLMLALRLQQPRDATLPWSSRIMLRTARRTCR